MLFNRKKIIIFQLFKLKKINKFNIYLNMFLINKICKAYVIKYQNKSKNKIINRNFNNLIIKNTKQSNNILLCHIILKVKFIL